MKRILLVSNTASMIVQFNIRNIKMLKDLGFEVHVACNYEKGNTCNKKDVDGLQKLLNDLSVVQHQIDFSRGTPSLKEMMSNARDLKTICCDCNIDVIFCLSFLGGLLGRIIGWICNKKVIYIAHGFQFSKESSLFKNCIFAPIEVLLSCFTDTLITINNDDYTFACKYMFPRANVYVPGVGIEIERYDSTSVDKEAVRKRLYISNTDYFILTVGELSKRKNQKPVMEIIRDLKDPHIKFVICGKGDLEESYKDFIRKYGLENQILLLGYRNDINELCASADLFCFSSFSEGLPVALMEAIASKTAIICSNIRGNNDLIKDKESLFNPKDKNDIKKCLLSAIKTHPQKNVEQNFTHLSNFSAQKVDELMLSIFKSYL